VCLQVLARLSHVLLNILVSYEAIKLRICNHFLFCGCCQKQQTSNVSTFVYLSD